MDVLPVSFQLARRCIIMEIVRAAKLYNAGYSYFNFHEVMSSTHRMSETHLIFDDPLGSAGCNIT